MEKLINSEMVTRRMKSARAEAGLTQLELAQKLGVTETTVRNWEKYPETVNLGKLRLFANACGVTMAYFFAV